MADLRELKDKAAELTAKGKLDRAADAYRELLEADPRDVGARQRLAEVLRRAGDVAGAVAVYGDVAERFARDGLLIKAIAICKTILEVDPRHEATQRTLAALYGRRAQAEGIPPPVRAAPGAPTAPAPLAVPATSELPPELEPEPRVELPLPPAAAPATETPFARIVTAAGQAVAQGVEDELAVEIDVADGALLAGEAAAAAPVEALPRVPLFSDLGQEAFVALAHGLSLRRFDDGQPIVEEGETGTAFYVVATGRVAVSRRDEAGEPVVLAHLGEGEFFGEMALLSGAPRAATVAAEGPVEVLELPADVLQALAGRHPHVAGSLRRFYRQRLLANAMAVSPVFRPFGREERKRLVERFRARDVAAGEVILREGEPSDGLYVILDGAVDVTKRKDGTTAPVGRLHEGDLFGEVSCLRKTPATATVTARRAGTVLRLPRADFDALVSAYPQILELLSTLGEERLEAQDAILSGHAAWAEEGLVLV
jgi:CRP-like cAMP-binding protein